MSFYGFGNKTINSTTLGVTSNPTTSGMLAEIDFNSSMATVKAGGAPVQVTWIVGAQTTLATFALEQVFSTGLDISTAGRDQIIVMVSSGQSAQFVTSHNVEPGDRFRVRAQSSFTGGGSAKIIAEPMV